MVIFIGSSQIPRLNFSDLAETQFSHSHCVNLQASTPTRIELKKIVQKDKHTAVSFFLTPKITKQEGWLHKTMMFKFSICKA